jgi:hypothetical protein
MEMLQAGSSLEEVAAVLGRTPRACENKWSRLAEDRHKELRKEIDLQRRRQRVDELEERRTAMFGKANQDSFYRELRAARRFIGRGQNRGVFLSQRVVEYFYHNGWLGIFVTHPG